MADDEAGQCRVKDDKLEEFVNDMGKNRTGLRPHRYKANASGLPRGRTVTLKG